MNQASGFSLSFLSLFDAAFPPFLFPPPVMDFVRLVLALLLVSGGLVGCASAPKEESDSLSTIPWNRPATWEGRGPLGGMMMMEGR